MEKGKRNAGRSLHKRDSTGRGGVNGRYKKSV